MVESRATHSATAGTSCGRSNAETSLPLCPTCGREGHLAFTLGPIAESRDRICRDPFHDGFYPSLQYPAVDITARPSLDPEVDRQLSQFIFEARRLAMTQFTRDFIGVLCVHCRARQTSDAKLDHDPDCAVGRVLHRLSALCDLVPSSHSTTERSSNGEATAHAAAEGQPRRALELLNAGGAR